MSFKGRTSGESLVLPPFCCAHIAVKRLHLEARRACHVDDRDVDSVDAGGGERGGEELGGEDRRGRS